MQFALNYSEAAADLIRGGLIQVDLFKCPDWPDVIAEAGTLGPSYTHFPLKAGLPEPGPVDYDAIAGQLQASATPHVNVHLDPKIKPGVSPFACVNKAIDQTIEQVYRLVEHFGADRVVVENVPYWQSKTYHARLAALPEFVSSVVEETGCGLLLDLSHARIAACELGMNDEAYLDAMPVHRLKELHVTGLARVDGWLRDHMPMRESDWSAFEWAMERIRNNQWTEPRIVAFEYGGVGPTFAWRTDRGVLAEQVPNLYDMVHARPARRQPVSPQMVHA